MCNKSTHCKSERQTQAGGNPVCPVGISWCGTAPCHIPFAHFPFEAWGTKTISFHKTPRNLCFCAIWCDQNLTVLFVCIGNEQVNLQWVHIPWECCPGCSSTVVMQHACVFLSGSQGTDLYRLCVATQDRYLLIQSGLRGQLDIDHAPDCMTKASLKSMALRCVHKAVLLVPVEKILHQCCKVIEIDLLNPSYALNFFCSILSQW